MPAAKRASSRCLELPENQLAVRAVARLVRSSNARSFAALTTIHGPPGTGKSLLVRTLMKRLTSGNSLRSVRLIAARDFPHEPMAELRSLDVLIIEDLQYLPNHAAESLNAVLEERGRRRRATLLTAHVEPQRLKKLPRRTLSRIAGGLVVAIEPYSAASRRRILERHCRLQGIMLEPAARAWLAEQRGGVRAMLGLLAAMKTDFRSQPITLEAAQAAAGTQRPGMERIVRRVAETFGVKVKELLGQSRLRSVLLPRHVAMYLARDVALLPLPQIGEHFGRDQSTVQHAVQKVRIAMGTDRQLAGTIKTLTLELA